MLIEGALSKDASSNDASGNMVVEDPKSMDIGAQVKTDGGSQTFELPPGPAGG